LSFLLIIRAGWVHRHQLLVIELLQAENRLLKNGYAENGFDLLTRNMPLTLKAKAIGRKALLGLDTIVSPDTLLRWHQRSLAQKWTFAHRRGPGRRGIMQQVPQLIVRMAQDNPIWGYTRMLDNRHSERPTEIGIEPSTGTVGDSYDNALAETVIGLYKTELIHHRGPWRSTP